MYTLFRKVRKNVFFKVLDVLVVLAMLVPSGAVAPLAYAEGEEAAPSVEVTQSDAPVVVSETISEAVTDTSTTTDEITSTDTTGVVLGTEVTTEETSASTSGDEQSIVAQFAQISATKIVCNNESDLPNWGNNGANITSSTATTFVANSDGNCHLQEGWGFQWSNDGVGNPGDNVNDGGAGWNDFTYTTNGSGVATATIPAGGTKWFREKMQPGYIPFSSDTSAPYDDVSAEFYCNTDVLHYDNWEFISNVGSGDTYHCVGFNVQEAPTTGSIKVCKMITTWDGDIYAGNPGSEFSINFLDTETSQGSSAGDFGPINWTTPLVFNTNLFPDNVSPENDVACETYDDLPFGNYYYGEESVSDPENYVYPQYNDNIEPVNAINFGYYSGELFNENEEDDGDRVTNRDGHIVLNADRPDRTLVVWNKMEKEKCEQDDFISSVNNTIFEFVGIQGGNTKCDESTITVTKIVDGGDKVVADFPLFVDQQPVLSGTTNTFDAGTYTVSETNLPGYTATFSGDCDANGTINLSKDEDATCTITNTYAEYGPYCGDGIVNQGWEQCDGEEGCSAQCQTGQCTEKAFAKVTVDTVVNTGIGDMTTDVYLGGNTLVNKIPSGTWFMVYDGSNYINDPTMDASPSNLTWADVPGMAVERLAGKLRVNMYGDHPDHKVNTEHSEGTIEYFNASPVTPTASSFTNDPFNGGLLSSQGWHVEKEFDTIKGSASNDELWLSNSDLTQNFYLGVGQAADSFFASYDANTEIQCEPGDATLKVKKVIDDTYGGSMDPEDFTMTVSGTNVSDTSFPGSSTWTTITLDAGAYSVDEVEANTGGYLTIFSPECWGTIGIGETKECTVINKYQKSAKKLGYVNVIKKVTNDNGGTKIDHDFFIQTTGAGATLSSIQGDEDGTLVSFYAGGPYSITEIPQFGYTATFSEGCSGTVVSEETQTCTVYNNDPNTEIYSPYCGDGIVNQGWEQCDGTEGCTAQCQSDDQCTDKAFARVNIENVWNTGTGDMTTDSFLGGNSYALNRIPNNTWFLIFDGVNYVNDPSMNAVPATSSWSNVPGLAIERMDGQIRTNMYGYNSHDGIGTGVEHADGYIEYFNTTPTSQSSDTYEGPGTNGWHLEKWTDTIKGDKGNDEIWIADNKSHFWIGVQPAADAFFNDYATPEMCGQGSGGDDGGTSNPQGNGDGSGGVPIIGGTGSIPSSVLGATSAPSDMGQVLGESLAQTGIPVSLPIILAIMLMIGTLVITKKEQFI
jgi:hypothetical protein